MEVIRVENISKLYDLGQVGTGTLSKDLNRWWARIRGKGDPYARIGQTNDRTKKANKDESVWALDDINFSVNQGEVVGIIGRNGAGKSTLLKIISRITTPTKGKVKIRGRIASLLEVGTGFHPEMTGRENIFMNGTLLGMTRREIQSKLDEIVEFAGVALYIDTPVKRYSSGMQVRLGFAVAAFLEPEILIVDEVLAVGDAEFQKKAIGRMQDVSKSDGRTVLFVSHNMDAVKSLCPRSILMSNGKLELDGVSEEVVSHYTTNQVIFTEIVNDKFTIRNFRFFYEQEGKIKESTEIPFGCDFMIEFKVNTERFTLDKKLYFALTIRNRNEQKIATLDNLYSGDAIEIVGDESEFVVRCKVKSNCLIPAEYTLDLWSGNFFETYLKEHSIGVINIIFSDYFGNGKLHNERQHGNFLLPNSWQKI